MYDNPIGGTRRRARSNMAIAADGRPSNSTEATQEFEALPRRVEIESDLEAVVKCDEIAVADCSFATQRDVLPVEEGGLLTESDLVGGDTGGHGDTTNVCAREGDTRVPELCETEYQVSRDDDQAVALRGATRRLRAPNHAPWRCRNLALPLHYFFAGMVQNITTGALFGVLMGTMAVPGHVYISSRIFVMAPWAFKPVFGFLSDCFPVCGFHRKPYCIVGWWLVVCAYSLLLLLFEEPVVPKYCLDTGHGDLGNFVIEAGICNPGAGEQAWLFIVLVALATFGIMIAESAADGLLLECAQSWTTVGKRGTIMLQQLIIRMLGSICGSTFLALFFNGRRHLGFFDFEIPFEIICLLMLTIGILMMTTWLGLADSDIPETMQQACMPKVKRNGDPKGSVRYSHCTEAVPLDRLDGGYADEDQDHQDQATGLSKDPDASPSPRLYNMTGSHCNTAGSLLSRISAVLCTSKFMKFTMFEFAFPIFAYITPPSVDMMKRYTPGIHVQQLQEQFTDIACYVLFVLCLMVLQRPLLHFNWRATTAFVTLTSVVGVCTICSITVFGLFRSQYFYQLQEFFAQLPRGYNYLLATLVTAELAPTGMEACVYGLISSAHSIAPLVGRSIGNVLYAHAPNIFTNLPVGALSVPENYARDDDAFRLLVCLATLTFGALCVASLVLLPLLPVPPLHKQAASNANSVLTRQNKFRCRLLSFALPCIFVAATLATVMAFMPTSSCDATVGGGGC